MRLKTILRLSQLQKIDRACRETGFFLLTGHGISPALVNDWFNVSREFFELPVATKAAVMPDADSLHNGYHGMDTTALAKGEGEVAPRSARILHRRGGQTSTRHLGPIGHVATAATNGRPSPRNSKPQGEACSIVPPSNCRAASWDCSQHRSVFCGGVLCRQDQWSFFGSGAIYYPVQTAPASAAIAGRSAYRLWQPDDPRTDGYAGGLQVLTKTGGWLNVPYVPDAFIINIGDMLARWSNDRWVSHPHRVLNPANKSRRVQTSPVGRVLPPSELRRRDRVSA